MLDQFPWLYALIAGTVIVLIADLIANALAKESRIGNAILSALVFAVIFGGLLYLRIITVDATVDTSKIPMPSTTTTTTGSGG
jgi:hypothetical protein